MAQQKETEIPKGWERTLVGSFLKLKNGYAFKSADYVEAGEDTVPVIRISDVKVDGANSDKANHVPASKAVEGFEIDKGDQLIAMSGATTGKVGVYQGITPAYQNQRVGNLKLISDENFNKQFKNYLIKAKSQAILDVAYGGAQPNVSARGVEEIEVLIPPLPEQKRIVEKLDSLLAQVDTIQQRLNNLPDIIKRFRQSVLAAAVSGKLTEQWRGESDYKTELGTEVPINWDVKVASEVCEKVQSGSTPRDNPFEQGGKVPFLKVYNIVNQKVDFDYRPQFVTEEVHSKKLKRSIALPGDVLMNIVGPPLGKVAILNDQYPEWNLNQAITLFRANELKLNKQYLYFVLCEGDLVRKVMPSTKGSVGQVNISLTQCRESTIPLPSIEEQTEIVRLVEQYFALADTLEKNVVNAKQRVDNLTQSILAKAFKGQLVPQDPNDEPADKLLERIKAAREEADKLEKAAKKAAKASKAKK